MRLLIVVLLLQLNGFLIAQCFSENFAFQEGENVYYDAIYQWGFIWVNAGEVSFHIKKDTFLKREVYHFDTYGKTHKKWEWFYKVDDRYQSYLDKRTLKPLWYHRTTSDGGYDVDNKFIFDQKNKKAYMFLKNSKKPFRIDTIDITPCTFDVVTLIYLARNIDFTKYEVNDKIPLKILLDGEIFDLFIRYKGKEAIELKNGMKYKCLVFSVLLVEGTLFKGGEDMTVWVTDDRNRIPVLVESKVLVGSVKGIIRSYDGLRNPMEAIVK